MYSAKHEEAVNLLLASISQDDENGLRASFLFGRPGAPDWEKRLGAEIFYNRAGLIRAALFVRRNGPSYLKYLPIGDIWSSLQRFVAENYWYMADSVFIARFEGSYAEKVPAASKARLAEALANSAIFKPKSLLTLFPLVPIEVVGNFDSEPFFLVAPEALDEGRLGTGTDIRRLHNGSFPPLADWRGRREIPSAWLGIRSPLVQVSNKMKASILGALALAPMSRYRYLFSGRKMFGGNCSISDHEYSTSFGPPHTPPLMHDIIIEEADCNWLAQLAEKIVAQERSVRRQLKALEYFYRAWETDPSERFPLLCMALDAIFGDANHATQAVIDGVRTTLGMHIRDARLRQLMNLRSAVIHGGAPDVYDSRKYASYYDEFEADPILDLELIVSSCLRTKIFERTFREQPDPNAEIINEAQALGRLPKALHGNTILDDLV